MLGRLIIIGIFSTALVAALVTAYPEPSSMAALSTSLAKHEVMNATVSASAPSTQASPQFGDGERENVTVSPALALQPEALKLSRRVGGQRFNSRVRPALIIRGVLSTGTYRQDLQIVRYPSATGERVDIAFGTGMTLFSWNAATGAMSSSGSLTIADRLLLERLIFDSADQFILAQLRGATYYVVARNVRPDDAPDNYSGPLWNVVRVDDPESDEQKRPLSRWRVYYLNSTTGLIDKVVTESQGDRIEAGFTDWREQAGEKLPSTITWTSQGRALMSFNLTSASIGAQ